MDKTRFWLKTILWKWLPLLLVSLCNGVLIGYTYGIAVLFLDIKDTFDANRAETSLVQSVNTGLMFGGGIISSLLSSYVGNGTCCIISSVLAALATSCGYFIHNLSLLIVSVGAIGGLCLCNIFTGLFTLVGKVYKEHYNLAISCLILGGGIGSSVFPYLNLFLLETFGWRGTFLILGAILLNCLPVGMVMHYVLKDTPITCIKQEEDDQANPKTSVLESHLSLWKDSVFVAFIVCLILRSVPIGLVSYFMLDIATYKGFSIEDGSIFLSVVGFGNLFGRLVTLLSRPIVKFNPVYEYSVFVIACGTFVFVLGLSEGYWMIVVSCGLFGITYGVISSTAGVACFKISGTDRYPAAIGIFNTGMGVGFGVAGPIGGAIRDKVDSYDHILFGFASVSFIAGLLLLTVMCVIRIKRHLKEYTSS